MTYGVVSMVCWSSVFIHWLESPVSQTVYYHSWVINYDDESDKSKKETPVVVTKVESADLDIYYPPKNLEFNHNINDDGVIGIDFKYILV